ncbi:MAG TPA: aminoglycoside phosphotransferase family protein [Mycobacteriales bacterium]|nr:aminoglycoside phosphotransferase family protein [Mycobacteriales bacterium]
MRKGDIDDRILRSLIGAGATAERTAEGTSTQVYRVERGDETLYLRVAEEPEASLAPEVEVHRMLAKAGVRVPEIVHYEPYVQDLDRSVVLLREIPGRPIDRNTPGPQIDAIYRAAGRDLALINSVPVRGFDWIVRDGADQPLRGERPSYAEFVLADGALNCLETLGFSTVQRDRIGEMLDRERVLDPAGLLAHGDLDTPHVFAEGGQYTGIIDFGEIRGADRWYDIAEFALHSDNPQSARAVEALLEGYAEVCALPPDHPQRVRDTGAMVIVHRLDKWLKRDGPAALDGWFFRWNRDRLVDLAET